MFVEAVCMPRCLILYTCGHGGDWNTCIYCVCVYIYIYIY
ncbi:unnamed protein product, partial [Staurois parvus]